MGKQLKRLWQVWNRNLRFRLMVGQVAVIAAIMVGACIAVLMHQRTILQDGTKQRALAIARTFSAFGATAVQEHLYQLQESMAVLKSDGDLLNLDVLDSDFMITAALRPDRIGMTLPEKASPEAESDKPTETIRLGEDGSGQRILVIMEPLRFKSGESIWIRVEYSLAGADRLLKWLIWVMVGITLLLVMVGIAVITRGFNQVAEVLRSLMREVGIPQVLLSNDHQESPQGEFEQLSLVIREANRLLVVQQEELRDQATVLERKVEERTAELARARDEAMEAAKIKAQFLATMSHEIRTPLNGIMGMTGLLLDSELSKEQREFAEIIQRSGDALLTIINDILDFSKIEAGRMSLETLSFDLRTLVEDTLDLLAELAHRKHLELVGLIDSMVPKAVRGDPGRIRQVLTNLVGNAIKFTEAGEVTVKVAVVKVMESEVEIRFDVVDTGIGISKEAQGRLFQAFSQADGSTSRKYGGTGLGLAICKQLVELMHGQIGMESTLGKGSCFWFTVRLEIDVSHSTTQMAKQVDRLTGMKVCLVDDNPTNCALLEQYAKEWGLRHATAFSGADALATMRAASAAGDPFDLALLDMEMPGMDGMELARHIKADPALASARLVLLTSIGRRGDAKLARDAGLAGYLTKPIRQSQLFDCLRLVMGLEDSSDGKNVDKTSRATLVTRYSLSEIASSTRGRLLVAEDNPVNQKVVVKMIEKLGYKVDVVSNGKEAVEAVQRQPYAVVLMDCQMPEMDGLDATRAIRTWEQGARASCSPSDNNMRAAATQTSSAGHIPIIAMTANAMDEDRQRCLDAGMDDFVSKPISLSAVEQVLTKWYRLPSSSRVTTSP